MDDGTIRAMIEELDRTEELFFISKSGENYKLIHSNLEDVNEWIGMLQYFLDLIKEKGENIDNNALDDLLNKFNIDKNNNETNN